MLSENDNHTEMASFMNNLYIVTDFRDWNMLMLVSTDKWITKQDDMHWYIKKKMKLKILNIYFQIMFYRKLYFI